MLVIYAAITLKNQKGRFMKKILVLLVVAGSLANAQTTTAPADAAATPTTATTTATSAKVDAKADTQLKKKKKAKVKPSAQMAPAVAPESSVALASAPAAEATSAKTETAAQGQSTTTAEVKPAAKKVSGSLVIGAAVMVADLKEKNTSAPIDTSNALTVMYTASDKIKVGASHNFAVRVISDRAQLADFKSDNGADSIYKTVDPTLNVNFKMPALLGSNEYAILNKYYLPITPESQAKKSNGVLRTQAYITWTLNPKIDVSFFGQARLYLNSSNNTDTKLGSDSNLRTIVGPVLGYNFNDTWNVYYNPYVDIRSAGFQRGKFDADTANSFGQDVGLWITLAGGKFIVNPSWATTSSKLGNSTYEGSGSDTNSEYDLNLIASF